MYKNILLCTDGSAGAVVATDYAIWFAKKLGAHLRVLYITDLRILEGPLLADISGAFGAQPYSALMPQLQQIQREKADTVLAAARQRCNEHSVDCDVLHKTGMLVPTMLDQERDADLIVLGQRGEHAAWLGDMLGSSVERMVRASIRPCLVTAADFRETRHILLAHDGSAESNKALRAGFDLAAALGMQVTIVTVSQPEHEEAASKVLQEAHEVARDRKLSVHAQLAIGDAEHEILHLRETTGADLIVMGAYGHTRIRELVLGSTTSHVIRKANVPVLLVRG